MDRWHRWNSTARNGWRCPHTRRAHDTACPTPDTGSTWCELGIWSHYSHLPGSRLCLGSIAKQIFHGNTTLIRNLLERPALQALVSETVLLLHAHPTPLDIHKHVRPCLFGLHPDVAGRRQEWHITIVWMGE